MPLLRCLDYRLAVIVVCLAVLGCGPPKPQVAIPVGPKGSKDPRLLRPIDLPDESGKAVLNELGVTDLQPTRKIAESKGSSSEDEKKKASVAEKIKSTGKKEIPYRRPTRWVGADELPYEFWEVQYLGNRPVGYLHQRVSPSAIGSAGIYRIDLESFVRVSRDKKRLDQRLKVTSIEEEDGRLRTIEATLTQGDSETRIEGNVVLGSLRLRTHRNEKSDGSEIPWPKEYGGPFAVAQSLKGKPMKPGETRKLSMLDPTLGQVVEVNLQAKDYLKTPLLDGLQHNLLEISCEVKLEGRGLTSTLWVTKDGETQKTYTSDWDIRSFRTERSFAESIRDAASCESFARTKLDLTAPIPDYATAESLVFEVRHPDLDPLRVLPGRTNQSVKSKTAFTATATVFAMREKSSLPDGVSPELSADDNCKQPSPVIQSDDSVVRKLADQFYEDKSLGKTVLERMRRGVYNLIAKKLPYSPLMSSAAEAARDRIGDSSEHAMLLAAVVRARGVPSRIAIGLIYNASNEEPGLVLHMWTEVYLKDHWVSIDASIENSTTNATYLKLVDSPLADQNPYAALLAALRVMEQLDVSIAE